MVNLQKNVKKASEQTLNLGLSFLFFGLALRTFGVSSLQSIFEGYKKIIPESDKFNRQTAKLSANWEFFKFQLADALANSPLFQKFIAFLISAIQQLQKLPEPIKTFIVASLGALVVFGTIFFIVGQIILAMPVFAAGVGAVGKVAALVNKLWILMKVAIFKASAAVKVLNATKLGGLVASIGTVLAALGVLTAAFIFANKVYGEELEKQGKEYTSTYAGIFDVALSTILGIIALFVLIGKAAASVGTTIVQAFKRAFSKAGELFRAFINRDWDKLWSISTDIVVDNLDDLTKNLDNAAKQTADAFLPLRDNLRESLGLVQDIQTDIPSVSETFDVSTTLDDLEFPDLDNITSEQDQIINNIYVDGIPTGTQLGESASQFVDDLLQETGLSQQGIPQPGQ